MSKLLVESSNKRISTIDRHIGIVWNPPPSPGARYTPTHTCHPHNAILNVHSFRQAFSGLIPDGRAFVNRARDQAAQWRRNYQSPMPISSIADDMGGLAQAYTLYSSVRPFGITAIIGGVDEDGKPGLYMIEPSGLYWVYSSYLPITRCPR